MEPAMIKRTITITMPASQLRPSIDNPELLKELGFERSDTIELRDAPADRGTEVALLRKVPAGASKGALHTAAAKTLRLLKSLVETGETPTLASNPVGHH